MPTLSDTPRRVITPAADLESPRRRTAKYFRKDQPARVICVVGSWPKKFDVEIDAIAVVDDPD